MSRLHKPEASESFIEAVLERVFDYPSHNEPSAPTSTLPEAISPEIPEVLEWHLPISYRTSNSDLRIPKHDISSFLESEYNTHRLDIIYAWLWWAGRPMPARPLHIQRLLQRHIVLVEKIDLHLIWARSFMFLKPIPRYLFVPGFWRACLTCPKACACATITAGKATYCPQRRLRRAALGFLYSYVGLVVYESDFSLARDAGLIPEGVTWRHFQAVLQAFLEQDDLHGQIDRRFVFGELRLGRLDAIYRLTGIAPLRGYRLLYTTYHAFWEDNLKWMASVVVYIALVLTAMQVGLAVPMLSQSEAFQAVAYGFTIFSIIGPLAAFAGITGVFVMAFLSNWFVTRGFYSSKVQRKGRYRDAQHKQLA